MTRMEGEILTAFKQEHEPSGTGSASQTVRNQNHDGQPGSAGSSRHSDSQEDTHSTNSERVREAGPVLVPAQTHDSSPRWHECPLCLENQTNLGNIPCGHVFCTP